MRTVFAWLLLLGLVCSPGFCESDIGQWEQFSPADLALTDNPREPGARGMYLFCRARADEDRMVVHGAIKIFNDAGRDLANFQLPDMVDGIRARTVRPDGIAVEIPSDEIMDKILIRKRGLKLDMKVFAFPDVEDGSILEYIFELPPEFYRRALFFLPLQKEIFCRESWIEFDAKMLKPYNRSVIDTYDQANIRTRNLGSRIRYGGSNIPAKLDEDYPPPESELSAFFLMYVGFPFVRGAGGLSTQDQAGKEIFIELFWKQYGEDYAEYYFDFMDGGRKLRRLSETILAEDTRPVEPAQKIYDYVAQNFNNDSFVTRFAEERMTEVKKKSKTNKTVNNVVGNGRGSSGEITLLCVALMRAAGLEAYPVTACGWNGPFFRRTVLADQFEQFLLAIESPEGRVYLDPATPYCPYGRVAWQKQGADAMLFHPGGGDFIQTPLHKDEVNRIHRTIDATFDGGTLRGSMKIECQGNPDFDLKNSLDDRSDEDRRSYVEELLVETFGEVELEACEMMNLRDREQPLVITAEFSVPDYTTQTRTRLMFKPVLFGRKETACFISKTRKLPMCFDYPLEVEERVTFHLPLGFLVDQLPEPVDFGTSVGTYRLTLEQGPGLLVSHRHFRRNRTRFLPRHYPAVRKFYEVARTADNTTAVLIGGE